MDDNKRAYKTLKSLKKTPARITSIIEDKNGQPLAEEYSILNAMDRILSGTL